MAFVGSLEWLWASIFPNFWGPGGAASKNWGVLSIVSLEEETSPGGL